MANTLKKECNYCIQNNTRRITGIMAPIDNKTNITQKRYDTKHQLMIFDEIKTMDNLPSSWV